MGQRNSTPSGTPWGTPAGGPGPGSQAASTPSGTPWGTPFAGAGGTPNPGGPGMVETVSKNLPTGIASVSRLYVYSCRDPSGKATVCPANPDQFYR